MPNFKTISRLKVKRKKEKKIVKIVKIVKMNIEKQPVLCTTLYRKPIQPCSFDGIFYQLHH